MIRRPPRSTRTDTLFPYTTLFRSLAAVLTTADGKRLTPQASDDDKNDPWLTEVRFAGPLPQNVDATLSLPAGVRDQSGRTLANAANFPLTFRIDRAPPLRSEEHTSELQSLMRISYAVFCLKKKNTNN